MPGNIEAKWRQRWADDALYRTPPLDGGDTRRTFYCLEFFPYPSGNGLSVGHGRNYVPTDVIARYHRMRGEAVLHPMGWDAFGLPAENEAIKRGIPPQVTTARYAANYRRQMTLIGCSYDWEREINSSFPEFYRWTQWFFLLLYRRGLAYRAMGRQWWCPGCQTVLANEQVDANGICWRGHPGVYRRDLEQWYFRITAYADRLLAGLDSLDWPEHILAMQRNWIGRSEGVAFEMPIEGTGHRVEVYTTRPDTIYGMTFVVLAPEHPLLDAVTQPERRAAVDDYRRQAVRRGDVDRQQSERQRDGLFTGVYAVNPMDGRRVPVYVADYVLATHGSGAIMGVPAHDERDFDFARQHGLPAPVVVAPPGWDGRSLAAAYTGPGVMAGSGHWDGLPSTEAGGRIVAWLVDRGLGRRTVQYRLRDWLISRQRFWGAPIPIVYCERCGMVPVPEGDLPVLLPAIDGAAADGGAADGRGAWLPGANGAIADGRSPLAAMPAFANTTCPACGGPARRETDTLDGFACSSWYFLRFVSPHYAEGPFDPAQLVRWGHPDLYVGGAEHAVMHLLYARFWTKVMADAGIVPFDEPFPVLRSQGTMHSRDQESGEIRRMSKSAGNVVTPDSVAEEYGADALRVYLLFMAPFENNTVWEEAGITGARRFLERTWRLVNAVAAGMDGGLESGGAAHSQGDDGEAGQMVQDLHRTIRRLTDEIEGLRFNTALAGLMEFLNVLVAYRQAHGLTAALAAASSSYVLLLAPFAPYIAEELWQRLGGPYSVHQQSWPAWDEALAAAGQVTVVVQVDGKVRDRLAVAVDASRPEVEALALRSAGVQRALAGRPVARMVYVPRRLVNLVTR